MYTVWLEDSKAEIEDQDREYPVCIAIEAESSKLAKEWGDKLSEQFSQRNENTEILNSEIEPLESYEDSDLTFSPLIKYGYEATDEEIGW